MLGLAFSGMKTFDVRNNVLPELRVETQALVCVTFASHYIKQTASNIMYFFLTIINLKWKILAPNTSS